MPFAHILDLRERRAAYANLLQALYSGKGEPSEGWKAKAQMHDLRDKIATLDKLIAAKAAD
jgi:hypothetical protein